MGGEKKLMKLAVETDRGSPPRGRGKAVSLQRNLRRAGITPAWAGKSISVPSIQSGAGDHPRVGGEKVGRDLERGAHLGSPPRGRGKVTLLGIRQKQIGITPAWAGKR